VDPFLFTVGVPKSFLTILSEFQIGSRLSHPCASRRESRTFNFLAYTSSQWQTWSSFHYRSYATPASPTSLDALFMICSKEKALVIHSSPRNSRVAMN